MAHTACLDCLVSTVSGCCKNTLGTGIASSEYITKLEQSKFLRYIWPYPILTTYLPTLKKKLANYKRSDLFWPFSVKKKKELKTLTPGTYIIKLRTAVFNNAVTCGIVTVSDLKYKTRAVLTYSDKPNSLLRYRNKHDRKRFTVQALGRTASNVIKHFTTVIYECLS